MKREKTFFGKNQALHFVRGIFKDTTVIRIATAYFELSGYELLEQVLQGKKIKLLIGREQDTQVKLESLLDEFIENTSEMPPENRIRLLLRFRNALLNGVLDLRIGKSQDIQISPRYLDHHAKLYIADESFCLVTSANLSKTGLVISREAGYIVDEPDDVRFFVAKFDDYFAIADPLIDKLLLVLDNILSMRDAYEVYIRSLLELYGLPDYVPSGELANLNRYQMPVVARALENLRELHGSYLVASTGLGKTVMASHIAMRLKAAGSIDRVLVFSPAGLKKMWLNSLWAAGVAARAYSYSILSLNDSRKNRSVLYLEDDLRTINDRTLLILDECHHLRNIDTGNKNHEIRIRNERVSKAVELNAYLLAMTATPYARKIDDINNQLALFRSEIKSGMFGKVKVKRKISRAGELSELEIATVLTAPTVVAQYCQTDTTGSRFLQFGDGKKRYFPDAVVMSNLQYSNSLNNVLLSLLDSHLLRRNTSQKSGGQLYLSNDTSQEGRRDGLFEARLLHQFCSSPAEAISCLEKMHIEEGYENMRFVDQSKLTNLVTALLPEANKILKEDDIKFKFLTQIIEKHSDEKIVIFCIYKKTADYLYSKISKKFKNLKVGLTSEQNTDQLEALLE
ncbi:MAG: DEAD/DEAH box helicase family protein, partial [Leptospiraceae bacterium]|nr:DEAD/DEAH box helicase family protein [Leptospiraceae bacterium]